MFPLNLNKHVNINKNQSLLLLLLLSPSLSLLFPSSFSVCLHFLVACCALTNLQWILSVLSARQSITAIWLCLDCSNCCSCSCCIDWNCWNCCCCCICACICACDCCCIIIITANCPTELPPFKNSIFEWRCNTVGSLQHWTLFFVWGILCFSLRLTRSWILPACSWRPMVRNTIGYGQGGGMICSLIVGSCDTWYSSRLNSNSHVIWCWCSFN